MSEAGTASDRRRLHPFTLVMRFLGLLPQFIPAAVAMYFAFAKNGEQFIGLALLVGLGATMAFAWWSWTRFSYEVGAAEIRIQSGVLSRNNRSIPFERIQDVNVEQKLLARMLGIATVKFETGSGGGEEDDGVLNAVDLAEAEQLRVLIRQRKAGMAAAHAPVKDDEAATAPIFAMNNRRILIAGFFNFSLVIFAVLGAVAQNLDFLIDDDLYDPRYWFRQSGIGDTLAAYDWSARILGGLAALFSLVIIGVVTGIIRTFIREYGFRLDRTETGLRRRRGLLTLTDTAMPVHRVQAAVILTGPVRRRFGWYHLKFQSLASDGQNESDHSVAPCATRDEMAPILAAPGILNADDATPFLPVNRAHCWLPLALILPFPMLGIIIGAAVAMPQLFWLLLLLPLPLIIGMLRWRHHRYALDAGQVYVRDGFWRQSLTLLPLAKVQSVDIRDNVLSRRLGLADIIIGVAGGSGILPLTVQAIPRSAAEQLRRQMLRLTQ